MSLTAGLFNSGIFKGGLFNGGLFKNIYEWSPASLFSAGEQGAWYDPSDLSTLFQDAAGTTPVTATGQSVRLILDKSGKENHATAPSDAARPVLQQDANGKYYLAFDGVDDGLISPSILGKSASHLIAVAYVNDGTTTSYPSIAEWSVNSSGTLSCGMGIFRGSATTQVVFRVDNNFLAGGVPNQTLAENATGSFVSGEKNIVQITVEDGVDNVKLYQEGALHKTRTLTGPVDWSTSSAPSRIGYGAFSATKAKIRIYGAVLISSNFGIASDTISVINTYLGQKLGN